nr:heparan-alpha-glucosaminide N-acetyltransferase domain-containing protein [Micrococcus sp. TA1]
MKGGDVAVATGGIRVPKPAEGFSTPGPAPPGGPVSRRVEGVDVARGLALIGIVVVNVLPDTPTGDLLLVWTVLAGRVAALFALIAGISIALQTGGRQPPIGRAMTAARGALALRAVLITGIGLLLGSTDTAVAIILPYYGILFLLAAPLLGLGRRTLLVLAVVFAVAGPVAMQLVRAGWPEMPVFDDEYTFGLAAAHPGVFLTDMLLTGNYPVLPWVAYICVGMVVGRLDLNSKKVAAALLGAGAALAVSTWLVSVLLLGPVGGMGQITAATPDLDHGQIQNILVYGEDDAVDGLPTTTGWWLAILAPYTSTPVTILHTVGTSLAVLGAVLLLVPYLGRTTRPLAAAGSMTLTLYSAHVVIMATDTVDPERPIMSIAIQVIVFILFAVLWRAAVGKGPLEAILAGATGWFRTLILTGHRPAPPPDDLGAH